MTYGERYKALLMSTIQDVDLSKVSAIIECLKDARAHGSRIFVCGSDTAGTAGSKLLVDTMRRANFALGPRLKIMNLAAQSQPSGETTTARRDQIFMDQLKSFAEPGDVVIGIQSSEESPGVLEALEYANWMNCRTILLTGEGCEPIPEDHLTLKIGSPHTGTVEDALLSVCHMLGYYFIDCERI